MKHTHITSQHRILSLNLKEIWQYRELILLFVKRGFQVSYKQTILGPLWLFINPLMTAIFDVLLFGNIAKLSTDGVPQLLFYLSGNALWSFFSGRVSSNSGTFTGNAGLFGKVYFPRLAMPVADVLSGIVRFGIQMVMVVILYLYYLARGMVQPNVVLLLSIPFLLLELGFMGMGIGIIISSMITKYRDLSVLVGFALQLWMYATPIVYPLSTVSGSLKTLLQLNPVTVRWSFSVRRCFTQAACPLAGLCTLGIYRTDEIGWKISFSHITRAFQIEIQGLPVWNTTAHGYVRLSEIQVRGMKQKTEAT